MRSPCANLQRAFSHSATAVTVLQQQAAAVGVRVSSNLHPPGVLNACVAMKAKKMLVKRRRN